MDAAHAAQATGAAAAAGAVSLLGAHGVSMLFFLNVASSAGLSMALA